jgi:hypothetical protein
MLNRYSTTHICKKPDNTSSKNFLHLHLPFQPLSRSVISISSRPVLDTPLFLGTRYWYLFSPCLQWMIYFWAAAPPTTATLTAAPTTIAPLVYSPHAHIIEHAVSRKDGLGVVSSVPVRALQAYRMIHVTSTLD